MKRPEPTIRLRVDPRNPGEFFACCGLLELADRAWKGGAEGWFEDGGEAFCIATVGVRNAEAHGAAALLEALRAATLLPAMMSAAELERRESLSARKVKLDDDEKREKERLDELWDLGSDGALLFGEPFSLRIDWHLDDRTKGDRFKTWAGQQTLVPIARSLKEAADAAPVEPQRDDWHLVRASCGSSLNVDAAAAASDLDVGFSFDPLKIASADRRVFLELLALVGLQRFRPTREGKTNAHKFVAWKAPLEPCVASVAASGAWGSAPGWAFVFPILFRNKYLKSFLPAHPRGENA
jgi:CRISPR-associated protein Csb3